MPGWFFSILNISLFYLIQIVQKFLFKLFKFKHSRVISSLPGCWIGMNAMHAEGLLLLPDIKNKDFCF